MAPVRGPINTPQMNIYNRRLDTWAQNPDYYQSVPGKQMNVYDRASDSWGLNPDYYQKNPGQQRNVYDRMSDSWILNPNYYQKSGQQTQAPITPDPVQTPTPVPTPPVQQPFVPNFYRKADGTKVQMGSIMGTGTTPTTTAPQAGILPTQTTQPQNQSWLANLLGGRS